MSTVEGQQGSETQRSEGKGSEQSGRPVPRPGARGPGLAVALRCVWARALLLLAPGCGEEALRAGDRARPLTPSSGDRPWLGRWGAASSFWDGSTLVGQPSLLGDGQRSPGRQGLVVSGAGGGHCGWLGAHCALCSVPQDLQCCVRPSRSAGTAFFPPRPPFPDALSSLKSSSSAVASAGKQNGLAPGAVCLLPWGPGSGQLGCHHGGTRGQGLFLSFLFFLGLFLSEGVRQWRGLCADLGLCSQGPCGLRQAWPSLALPSVLAHNDGGRAGVLSTSLCARLLAKNCVVINSLRLHTNL